MKKLNKLVLIASLALFAAGRLCAQQPSPQANGGIVVFRFLPGNDMFYVPWADNRAKLAALAQLTDEYRAEIAAGRMPVYVDGYCASLPARADNLAVARLRASRVKSELISQHGLKEADFVTANHARAYGDCKDVVVVTLRLPAKDAATVRDTATTAGDGATGSGTAVQPDATPVLTDAGKNPVRPGEVNPPPRSTEQETRRPVRQDNGKDLRQDGDAAARDRGNTSRYRFALRTNLLYDAVLMPTLGVEWRVNDRIGVRVDGSFSRWGGKWGEIQRIWLVSPEVRWYLPGGRFYAGVAGNYGEYNLYGHVLGGLFADDTGYKGRLWSAGLAVGYRLPLWRCISADFNLGLGYTRSEYDSYTAPYGPRIIRQHDRKKNFWGPTQAGVTLVWNFAALKMKNEKPD